MDWKVSTNRSDSTIHFYDLDKDWLFIQRFDGVFLIYKSEKYIERFGKNNIGCAEVVDYNYQGIKLHSIFECEDYIEQQRNLK